MCSFFLDFDRISASNDGAISFLCCLFLYDDFCSVNYCVAVLASF